MTVGDGTTSWGDFNAADETAIQAAINASVTSGDTIYVKRGVYTLANDVQITKGANIEFDTQATVVNAGGAFDLQIPSNQELRLKGLLMIDAGSGNGNLHSGWQDLDPTCDRSHTGNVGREPTHD